MVTSNFFVFFFVLLGVGCTPQCEKFQFEPAKPLGKPLLEFKQEKILLGEGPYLKMGDTIEINYRGWIYDPNQSEKKGSLIADTYSLGKPLVIHLGEDEIIKGLDLGLQGMKKGDIKRIYIPSSMAYGDQAAGAEIPKGAHLIYEVEIVSIKSKEDSKGESKEE